MDVKNVEVKELEGEKLQVTIEVKQTNDKNPQKDRKFFTSKEVRKYLSSKGYKNLGRVTQDTKVSNFQGSSAATGTWVFSKKQSSQTTATAKKSVTTTKVAAAKKTATK